MHTMETNSVINIEKYRKKFESEEHWNLKKNFLLVHKDRFPEERLVCLAQIFVNIVVFKCRYSENIMKQMEELSFGIGSDYLEGERGRLKRTLIDATEAAKNKVNELQVSDTSSACQLSFKTEAGDFDDDKGIKIKEEAWKESKSAISDYNSTVQKTERSNERSSSHFEVSSEQGKTLVLEYHQCFWFLKGALKKYNLELIENNASVKDQFGFHRTCTLTVKVESETFILGFSEGWSPKRTTYNAAILAVKMILEGSLLKNQMKLREDSKVSLGQSTAQSKDKLCINGCFDTRKYEDDTANEEKNYSEICTSEIEQGRKNDLKEIWDHIPLGRIRKKLFFMFKGLIYRYNKFVKDSEPFDSFNVEEILVKDSDDEVLNQIEMLVEDIKKSNEVRKIPSRQRELQTSGLSSTRQLSSETEADDSYEGKGIKVKEKTWKESKSEIFNHILSVQKEERSNDRSLSHFESSSNQSEKLVIEYEQCLKFLRDTLIKHNLKLNENRTSAKRKIRTCTLTVKVGSQTCIFGFSEGTSVKRASCNAAILAVQMILEGNLIENQMKLREESEVSSVQSTAQSKKEELLNEGRFEESKYKDDLTNEEIRERKISEICTCTSEVEEQIKNHVKVIWDHIPLERIRKILFARFKGLIHKYNELLKDSESLDSFDEEENLVKPSNAEVLNQIKMLARNLKARNEARKLPIRKSESQALGKSSSACQLSFKTEAEDFCDSKGIKMENGSRKESKSAISDHNSSVQKEERSNDWSSSHVEASCNQDETLAIEHYQCLRFLKDAFQRFNLELIENKTREKRHFGFHWTCTLTMKVESKTCFLGYSEGWSPKRAACNAAILAVKMILERNNIRKNNKVSSIHSTAQSNEDEICNDGCFEDRKQKDITNEEKKYSENRTLEVEERRKNDLDEIVDHVTLKKVQKNLFDRFKGLFHKHNKLVKDLEPLYLFDVEQKLVKPSDDEVLNQIEMLAANIQIFRKDVRKISPSKSGSGMMNEEELKIDEIEETIEILS